ncbi:sensor histidine kinase [Natronospora cellulosivora (SeqCode)]
MFTDNAYRLIFFIYGLSFFTMGISALQEREVRGSNFPLVKAIKHLGYFGILHGIVEWLYMIIYTDYWPLTTSPFYFIAIINAFSFFFLWRFGSELFENDNNDTDIKNLLPWIIISIYTVIYLIIIFYLRGDSIYYMETLNVLARYSLGLPAGIASFLGLYKNGKMLHNLKLKNISVKFKVLAVLFATYGFLAGFIVEEVNFFPANIINVHAFTNILGFPVQLARTIVAVAITLLFINIIHIFIWEAEFKIDKLSKQQFIWQEKRKLGQVLHDKTIQSLFAVGLAIENLISINDENIVLVRDLESIKGNLNLVIQDIRGFIRESSLEEFNINSFKIKLYDLIDKLAKISKIDINLNYGIAEVILGSLESKVLEQIYYIIQEAVNNSIKHSKGSKIMIDLRSTLKSLNILIKDNGEGFKLDNLDQMEHYGLGSMRDRAKSIGAALDINSSEDGVEIFLKVPWEGSNEKRKN